MNLNYNNHHQPTSPHNKWAFLVQGNYYLKIIKHLFGRLQKLFYICMSINNSKMKKDIKPSKEFNIVFVTNKRHIHGIYKRILVSANNLPKWVGEENAKKAIELALESKGDKFEKKFREHGRVIFYTK